MTKEEKIEVMAKEEKILAQVKKVEEAKAAKKLADESLKKEQAELDKMLFEILEEEQATIIKNPLYTIEKGVKTKKDLNITALIEDKLAHQYLFQYIDEKKGGIKIGAEKTFEKYMIAKGVDYNSFCKVKNEPTVSITLRPDVQVEEEMEI